MIYDAKSFDPLLHILRTAGYSIKDAKMAQEWESARYNLYLAISKNNEQQAELWLQALEEFCNVIKWDDPLKPKRLWETFGKIQDGLIGATDGKTAESSK